MCISEKAVCVVTYTVVTHRIDFRALVYVLGILNYITDLET